MQSIAIEREQRSSSMSSRPSAAVAPRPRVRAWQQFTRRLSQSLSVAAFRKQHSNKRLRAALSTTLPVSTAASTPTAVRDAAKLETRDASLELHTTHDRSSIRQLVPLRDDSDVVSSNACKEDSSAQRRACNVVRMDVAVQVAMDGEAERHVQTTRAIRSVSTATRSSPPPPSVAVIVPMKASAIPRDLPLVQYVAECCVEFARTSSSASSATLAIQYSDDVETQLFLTCIELRKWTLAQTLAERLQRRITLQLQLQHDCTSSRSSSTDARIPVAGPNDDIPDDDDDAILRFLDACSTT